MPLHLLKGKWHEGQHRVPQPAAEKQRQHRSAAYDSVLRSVMYCLKLMYPLSGSHAAHQESASHALGETLLHTLSPKPVPRVTAEYRMLRGSDGSFDCPRCVLLSLLWYISDLGVSDN